MGAAPVLIMLAALGVDYGWQPDGTTSARGDNVEYIVQVSPDHLQRLQSLGEITSTIDPSIQGRVSRIVVRVGTGPLPKNAGRVAVSTASAPVSALASSDNDSVPIPEIGSAAVMKPDPQGGFQMPGDVTSSATSALDQVRNRATDAANQFGAQVRSTLDNQVNSLGQSAADALGRATGTAAPANNAVDPMSGMSAATSAANRDNRWADLSNRGTAAAGPSTAPVDASARTTPWADFVGPLRPGEQPAADPRAADPRLADPRVTDPRAMNVPSLGSPFAAQPSSSNTAATNPSTARDPNDPKWSGYGASTTFGALPPVANSTNAASQTPTASAAAAPYADPRYSATAMQTASTQTTAATGGLTRDAQGNLYDSLGRPVDAFGRLLETAATNPTTPPAATASAVQTDRFGNRLDAYGYPVDAYGRRLDAYPATTTDPRLALQTDSRTASTVPSYPGITPNYPSAEQSGYLQPPYLSAANNAPTLAQQKAEQELAATREQLRSYQQRDANAAQTRMVNLDEQATTSASDQLAATRARLEQERLATLTKPRSVSAQAFFNFVLLISVVGNAYLIFETNNLRRKFRNMISSVRSAKVGPQAATQG